MFGLSGQDSGVDVSWPLSDNVLILFFVFFNFCGKEESFTWGEKKMAFKRGLVVL